MSFVVAEECLRLGLRSGLLGFRNLRLGPTVPALRSAIAEQVGAIRGQFADAAAVRFAPDVVRFQELLRQVGVNPRREQPSVERLLTFALKRGDLPAVNSLVDAYNLVSVRTLCSLGAHDIDRIALPITLRLLAGTEPFTPLGSDKPASVAAGEFGYVDAAGRV